MNCEYEDCEIETHKESIYCKKHYIIEKEKLILRNPLNRRVGIRRKITKEDLITYLDDNKGKIIKIRTIEKEFDLSSPATYKYVKELMDLGFIERKERGKYKITID